MTGIATYLLIWPADGIMRKEDIRRIYDGSIFFQKAKDYEQNKHNKPGVLASKLL